MKVDIHPKDYRLVVFKDLNSDTSFLIKSTAQTKETVKHTDGQTYPLVKLHITSASHPFYTGQEKMIDIEGRIDKFKTRRQAAEQSQQVMKAKSLKVLKQTENQKSQPQIKGVPKVGKLKKISPPEKAEADEDKGQTMANDSTQPITHSTPDQATVVEETKDTSEVQTNQPLTQDESADQAKPSDNTHSH